MHAVHCWWRITVVLTLRFTHTVTGCNPGKPKGDHNNSVCMHVSTYVVQQQQKIPRRKKVKEKKKKKRGYTSKNKRSQPSTLIAAPYSVHFVNDERLYSPKDKSTSPW